MYRTFRIGDVNVLRKIQIYHNKYKRFVSFYFTLLYQMILFNYNLKCLSRLQQTTLLSKNTFETNNNEAKYSIFHLIVSGNIPHTHLH